MSFTLGKVIATRLYLYVPEIGVASADVELSDATMLAGLQVLQVGDLALSGVVMDGGGPVAARSQYEWRAGTGRWQLPIPAKGFGNSQGVQRSQLIRDAALAAGEPVNLALPEARLGAPPAAGYVRLAGPAWDTLRALAVPWWPDAAGVTQIGPRPSAPAPVALATLLKWDREEGRRVYVPDGEGIAGWLPGNTIDGETIVTLEVTANEGEPIQITVYTRGGDASHDIRSSLDEIVKQNTAETRYFGVYEYTVASVEGKYCGLVPVDASLGLPTVGSAAPGAPTGIDQLWGIPGFDADLSYGMTVVLGFVNGQPSRPYIMGAGRPDGSKNIPENVRLDASDRIDIGSANQLVARETDKVNVGNLTVAGPVNVGGLNQFILTLTPAFGPPTLYQILALPGVIASFTILPGGGIGNIVGLIDTPTQGKTYA